MRNKIRMVIVERAEKNNKAINLINGNFVNGEEDKHFIDILHNTVLAIPLFQHIPYNWSKIDSEYLAEKVFKSFKGLLQH